MFRTFETTLAGRPLVIETGKMAQLANGSCLVRYGDTVVLCTATASAKPRDGIDFFPLSVDYEEKLYSVGKIPGSFMKREGKPSEKAILTSRVIDRPIRPLFPSDLRNDVSVVTTVMSVEQDNSPEIAAMIGASIAISISDIPFAGPIGGVWIGLVDDEFVINPTVEQREKSLMHVTVAGTRQKVVMIEAGAKEVEEDKMLAAIKFAHKEIIRICDFIDSIVAEIGKPKFEYDHIVVDPEMYDDVKEFAIEKVRAALDTDDKTVRDARMKVVTDEVVEHFAEKYPDSEAAIGEVLYKLQKYVVRRWILDDGKRVDGRGLDEIRPLAAEVGLLPRVHGSGMFTRGQTQVLTAATLGPLNDTQKLDGIDEEEYKRYMHHYNFPSYSVGETRPSRGPGRREIGHGALAERALEPVIPSEEEFPYAIRLVSEVLSSNGSTSQGSICGSTLALMDAGVPIKTPIAGISCGLVTEGDRFITMVDIQGLEDFFGDMDFKVAGSKKGITAIQVDIKTDGLSFEVIEEALRKTRDARYYILDEVMLKAIDAPRDHLSQYAPKVAIMHIDPEKIRDVIGTGGKVIQKIVADTGAKIDIEDDGRVLIFAVDQASGEAAQAAIEAIVKEPEVGEIYTGKVVRIMPFGAFVEILPGKDGMIHISKLDKKRVAKVEDVVNIGDEVTVKVIEIDKQGRINLSRKDLL
ncbi:MAG TPA: polyribonucleotide nucleotidyltransferase [Candidatus Aphodoplasma excrementigallinarum]|uniref:Polyribonucleotide nucleotidyltransferase n=1 Tax=Candidatus Aphodoplasma excrementigallinarum TaxID=2840673 RepID=A0A9D1NHX2_9FIRM|nr:polyribonucleotide nucleotidyltransferase [Candidatus Aphodoplasma excrementigallinarum]